MLNAPERALRAAFAQADEIDAVVLGSEPGAPRDLVGCFLD